MNVCVIVRVADIATTERPTDYGNMAGILYRDRDGNPLTVDLINLN